MNRLRNLSIFFPCYNDSGTITSMIVEAMLIGRRIADDFEVIVIDDGSEDGSRDILNELEVKYDNLRIIFHDENRGYGGAIRAGINASQNEFIFYTDGDAQYDVRELILLVKGMNDDVDVVNGYKLERNDPIHRIILGRIYQLIVKFLFGLKIRDIDCDFRLMRKSIFEKIELEQNSGAICIELIKKIQDAGFRFAEAGVHHYSRTYGKSQFFNFPRIMRIVKSVFFLWIKLVLLSKMK